LLRQKIKSRRRAAFTLMEMLVVVAIIVALAGIGGFFLMGALSDSKKSIAQTQVKGPLTQACMTYSINHGGNFPDNLADLLKKDDLGKGPYLDNPDALEDPWSTPNQKRFYQYDKTGPNNMGMKPDIWAVDPKDNSKIGNWPAAVGQR
jgi:prepilin-type N-terminal cleavage/methylation domain-containing protein